MKTDITVVLDRSGSMASCSSATVEGFNHFVADQQKEPGEAVLTLVQFDHEYEVVYSGKPIAEVPGLSHIPRGSTALLDAIGRAIREAESRLASSPADKVVVVILTDGQENASKEFTQTNIRALIEKQEGLGWTFVYLGANQNAIEAASHLAICADNAVTYGASAQGMSSAFVNTSKAVKRLRGGPSGQCCKSFYSVEDRAEIEKHAE